MACGPVEGREYHKNRWLGRRQEARREFLTKNPIMRRGIPLLALWFATLGSLAANDPADESIATLFQRADKGDLKAEVTLGGDYYSGFRVEKNPKEALKWYLKAAVQGDRDGALMASIGGLYEKGIGVERDPEKAAEWYLKAGELNAKADAVLWTAWQLLRLSQAGLIKEKYAGYQMEGTNCWFVTKVDETTPVEDLVKKLIFHTEELYTGKSDLIGYNPQMLSIAARGDQAIPYLLDLVKKASSPEVRRAGLLTIHLIGIRSNVVRYDEVFQDRRAREALWDLMQIDGLTDEIAQLLKLDPWPADVPAIMKALAQVTGDCPGTLNALLRYPMEKRPIDTLANSGLVNMAINFSMPEGKFSERDYVGLMIEPLLKALGEAVDVEKGLLDQFSPHMAYGSGAINSTETIRECLQDLTGTQSAFSYCGPGRSIFYYTEGTWGDPDRKVILHLCTAATAKKRLLDWWRKEGRDWYCYSLP